MYSNTSYHQGPFEQTVGALLDLEMSDLGGRFDISQYLSDREKIMLIILFVIRLVF